MPRMTKRPTPGPNGLPLHQARYGAMSLATTSLGHESDPSSPKTVKHDWDACRLAHLEEGIDVGAEYKSWLDELIEGDESIIAMATRRLPWLRDLKPD